VTSSVINQGIYSVVVIGEIYLNLGNLKLLPLLCWLNYCLSDF